MGFFDYLRMMMGWWSSVPPAPVLTPYRLLHSMSYSGGPQAVQSYSSGGQEQIQAFAGGPQAVMTAEIEE